jgi:hypothetical protein
MLTARLGLCFCERGQSDFTRKTNGYPYGARTDRRDGGCDDDDASDHRLRWEQRVRHASSLTKKAELKNREALSAESKFGN